MKNLKKQLLADIRKQKAYRVELIKAVKTSKSSEMEGWQLKDLLTASTRNKDFGTIKALKQYLSNRWNKQIEKSISEVDGKLSFIYDYPEIKEITITVEWKRNRTWGNNPTAETFISGLGRLSSGSIGGCGYDKQSTAVAEVLNQIPQFKQLTLRVGYDVAKHGYLNPCQDMIEEKYPSRRSHDRNNYKPMPFYPTTPSDPDASIANVLIKLDNYGTNYMLTENEREVFEDQECG